MPDDGSSLSTMPKYRKRLFLRARYHVSSRSVSSLLWTILLRSIFAHYSKALTSQQSGVIIGCATIPSTATVTTLHEGRRDFYKGYDPGVEWPVASSRGWVHIMGKANRSLVGHENVPRTRVRLLGRVWHESPDLHMNASLLMAWMPR